MEIKNLSWNENVTNKNNHPLLPKSLRDLIVGKSGCGIVAEPSSQTWLVGLFEIVSFWKKFVSTRV